MKEQTKDLLKDKLQADYKRLNSLSKLEQQTGVSKAYLSQILNGKADPGEATWNKLGNYYKIHQKQEYQIIMTDNLETIHNFFFAAMKVKSMYCIIGNAGCGKSTASKAYARNKDNVFYLECRNYSQKRFLIELAKAMNVQCGGTHTDYVDAIRKKLSETAEALIILDEASQLNDNCLLKIKEIYGDYESSKAGIVLLGVQCLENTLLKGSSKDKKGFTELLDRIQYPFTRLKRATEKEVAQICYSNGVSDESWIDKAISKAKVTGSFRAVEYAINAQKIKQL